MFAAVGGAATHLMRPQMTWHLSTALTHHHQLACNLASPNRQRDNEGTSQVLPAVDGLDDDADHT